MLQEALQMEAGNAHIQEEMREVEEELAEDSSMNDATNVRGRSIPLEAIEEGHGETKGSSSSARANSPAYRLNSSRSTSPRRGPSISFPRSTSPGHKDWAVALKERVRSTLLVLTNPVFAQAFILTFLGEWGDRSQITTIAMAGANVRSLFRQLTLFWS